MTTTLNIQPLGPAIGAVVSGIDLTQPLNAAQHEQLTQALVTHQALFFENQPLTPAQQRDFAVRFGDLHVHPIYPNIPEQPEVLVLDTHADNLPDNDHWHTDVTFIETPPLGSVLSAQHIPPSGGDTLWSSAVAVYEALSTPLRAFLGELTAVHDFGKAFPEHRFTTPSARAHWEKARTNNPPVVHPVIRTHPVSGRKGLFVNEGFTTRIVELKPRESEALLNFLFAQVDRPEFTVRWRWKTNDVAFWDNRLTQHYATADYLPHRRVMHRATILGDRPY